MTYISIMVVCMAMGYCYVMFRFWRGFETSIDDTNTPEKAMRYPQVSVIVPFRNEASTILPCLGSILNVDYPNELVELILVNDGSTDHSVEIIKTALDKQYKGEIHVKLLHSIEAGKKSAIEAGIKEARFPYIFCTDGDCRVPRSWIKSMISSFIDDVEMVTGPVVYKNSDSIFGKLQALDILGLVAVGSGSLRIGLASMCNGANIAYTKEAFIREGGFMGNEHLASGDDLFLMHKFHGNNPRSVYYSADRNSAVETLPEKSISSFLQQRRRWASKGRHYRDSKLKGLALLVLAVNFGILGLGLASIFLAGFFKPFLLALLIKSIGDFLILRSACKQYGQEELLPFFPLAQILHLPYVIWTAISSQIGQIKWKDRPVNS